MRKILLFLLVGAFATAQEQTVDLSMGGGYLNEVYLNLADESTQSYDRAVWDIAFLRTSNYNQGIRINEGKGLNIFEASNNINDWDTLDISAADDGEPLHNSETDWTIGAFNMGSASYGWGEYSMADHHIRGSVIFLIEHYASSSYYKVLIEDYFGAYTLKYAKWNGNGWNEDQTAVIPNATNQGHLFNYFNLENNEIVEASPAMENWDMVFKRYSATITTNTGEQVPYTVSGVLTNNNNVTVAKVDEAIDAGWADTTSLTYSSDINTIGYNWKVLNSDWDYEIVPNKVFYLKASGVIYRLYFTHFGGSSTGNVSLKYEKQNLSTVDVEANVKFGVYPNPVTNNQITLVYENAKALDSKADVEIYNMAGQMVFNTQLNNASGLFQRDIQLNNLPKGVYILKFTQGKDVKTEKLIIK